MKPDKIQINYRFRRFIVFLCIGIVLLIVAVVRQYNIEHGSSSPPATTQAPHENQPPAKPKPTAAPTSTPDQNQPPVDSSLPQIDGSDALSVLATLAIKGRASKTDYKRIVFSDGWAKMGNCDMRNLILQRDMVNVTLIDNCKVRTGELHDAYSGKTIEFVRGAGTSDMVQIDHVVALSNAWQTGAQGLSSEARYHFANDELNLIAVDGKTNQDKGDSDAATWLPPNRDFRCQYVARQIAVKKKYGLWLTSAESDAMKSTLSRCPGQKLPEK